MSTSPSAYPLYYYCAGRALARARQRQAWMILAWFAVLLTVLVVWNLPSANARPDPLVAPPGDAVALYQSSAPPLLYSNLP